MRFTLSALGTLGLVLLTVPALADERAETLALYQATVDAGNHLIEIAGAGFSTADEAAAMAARVQAEVNNPLSAASASWHEAALANTDQSAAWKPFEICAQANDQLVTYTTHFQRFLRGLEKTAEPENGIAPFSAAIAECESLLGVES